MPAWPWSNLPLPSLPWVRKMQERVEKAEKVAAAALKLAEAAQRSGAGAASGLGRITGLPAPIGPQSYMLAVNGAGLPTWVPNVAGMNPEYHIQLEEGGGEYWVDGAGFGDMPDVRNAVPPVTFADDGTNFYTPLWDLETIDGSFAGYQVSADIAVYVVPHADGDVFTVAGALDTGFTSNQPTSRLASFFNTSYDYSATIRLTRSVGGTPSIMYSDGSARIQETRTLRPRERLVWSAETALLSTQVWMVRPIFDNPNNGEWGNLNPRFPLDFWYWENVQSLKESHPLYAFGTLSAPTESHKIVNQRDQWMRFGMITASVRTAPVGAPIQIDVKVDGVSLFASPLEIPAGETIASKAPDSATYPNAGGFYDDGSSAAPYVGLDSVLWLPGAAVTFEIVGVGTTAAGSDLTVQVWAG